VPITVSLLADDPEAINVIADLRWREWGHAPEPEDPAWWLDTTMREAGRTGLPITFVAHDDAGDVMGAVGLDEFDLDERRDTSPWVTGMIVRADRRGEGIGRALMAELERWATGQGVVEVWVGTDLAAGFYERCGWVPLDAFTDATGQRISVLHKRLSREQAADCVEP
jgi:GNAT superfamily N-acetyltransferase